MSAETDRARLVLSQVLGAGYDVQFGHCATTALVEAVAAALAEARRQERERVVARILDILDGRIDREEYGHAKAAVTLDIEAIRAAFPAQAHGAADGGGEGANG